MTKTMKPEDVLKAWIAQHRKNQEADMAQGIAGDLMLFKKGLWSRGKNKTEVPAGTLFKPNPFEFWHGWQRFEDGHVADLDICRFYDGEPAKPVDADEEGSGWEPNWRIIMQDEDGKLITFSSVAVGGKIAFEELLEAYRTDTEHSGLWPVVAIRTTHYDTRERKEIARPSFEIVDWIEPWAEPPSDLPALNGGEQAAIEGPKASQEETKKAPRRNFNEELDDEIPY
jgi:hypothetical protein